MLSFYERSLSNVIAIEPTSGTHGISGKGKTGNSANRCEHWTPTKHMSLPILGVLLDERFSKVDRAL